MSVPAANAERLRAYRLRDIVRRRRRELSPDEQRWLSAYDKKHPPRGPRASAEPRGAPLPPGEMPGGALRVETIPTTAPAAAPPEPEEAAPEAAPPADGAPPSPSPLPPPPEAAGPPPLAVTAPSAAPPSLSNEAAAGFLAALFASELGQIAGAVGYEVPKEAPEKLAEGYRLATLNVLNRYFPDTGRTENGDLMVCAVGSGVIVGGPPFRQWLTARQKAEAIETTAAPVRPAAPPAPIPEPEPVQPSRGNDAVPGY